VVECTGGVPAWREAKRNMPVLPLFVSYQDLHINVVGYVYFMCKIAARTFIYRALGFD